MSTRLTFAVSTPAAAGVNVTMILQKAEGEEAEGARVAGAIGQSFVWLKELTFGPVIEMLVRESGAVPVLLRRIDWVAADVP